MRIKRIVVAMALLSGVASWTNASAIGLNQAVEQAVQENPEVRIQTNELMSRKQEIEQARAGYRPQVDLTAGVGYEHSDNNSTRALGYDNRSLIRKEAALTLRQMLFDGFATRSEVERQQARFDSAFYRVAGASENIALDAVKAYLEVLRQQQLLELSAKNLEAHDRIYSQVELRHQAGVGRNSDLEQVRGRRASANASRLSDVANLKDAESRYLNVVGDLPRDLEPVAGSKAQIPANLEEAIAVALKEHPTLLSAEADVMATLAQNQAAQNNFYPKLDFELGTTWGEDQDGVKGEQEDLTAMLRMRYNLYSGGRDTARSKQTANLINEAKEVRNRTYRQVVESLRLSWTSYQATMAQLDSLKQHLVSAEKTREAYRKQFNLGKRTLLDLLNTENEVFQARRAYSETQTDYFYAQYRILVGMGRLLGALQLEQPAGEGAGDKMLASYAEIAPRSATLADFSSRPEHGYQQEAPAQEVPGPEAMLEQWRKAWESRDVDAYLAHYSRAFAPAKGRGLAVWQADRRRIIGKARDIRVTLADIKTRVDGDTASVSFRQSYSSRGYTDSMLKMLRLRREGDQWKIVSESNR